MRKLSIGHADKVPSLTSGNNKTPQTHEELMFAPAIEIIGNTMKRLNPDHLLG